MDYFCYLCDTQITDIESAMAINNAPGTIICKECVDEIYTTEKSYQEGEHNG